MEFTEDAGSSAGYYLKIPIGGFGFGFNCRIRVQVRIYDFEETGFCSFIPEQMNIQRFSSGTCLVHLNYQFGAVYKFGFSLGSVQSSEYLYHNNIMFIANLT